ncbi:hypothetical protein [Streptomyces sp. MS2.AVA.5]|uniref:Uncharacterized protein n=1 Tax=Streptomyces achmelvichensis TaxID=3134111 RepID=A0ACC6Q8K9_9ACTN
MSAYTSPTACTGSSSTAQNSSTATAWSATLDNRDAAPLPSWRNELSRSGLPPRAGIAGAPREDQHAVAQGISTAYNSGGNEGHITEVKHQKRLIATHTGAVLLRHRVVLIAHLRRRHIPEGADEMVGATTPRELDRALPELPDSAPAAPASPLDDRLHREKAPTAGAGRPTG